MSRAKTRTLSLPVPELSPLFRKLNVCFLALCYLPFRSITWSCMDGFGYYFIEMFPISRWCVALKNQNSIFTGSWIISPFSKIECLLYMKNSLRSITWERFDLGTSYLICLLVITSRWALLMLRSMGQRSRSVWPWAEKNSFRLITWEPLISGTSYLVDRFVMTNRWTLLVLRSVGQRSRSVWL